MCIHIERELFDEISFWHREGLKKVSGVQLYDARGRFVGSWVCFYDQPQSIAQAAHALLTWHPEEGNYVNLALVNSMRAEHGLPRLKMNELPRPQPLVMEGLKDEDGRERTRFLVAKWLRDARNAEYARA